MKFAACCLCFIIGTTSSAQCVGYFPAPWAPLRPDPTGADYPEKTLYLDLSAEGPASLVLVHLQAGNHINGVDAGRDAYIDRGEGWQRFGVFAPSGTGTTVQFDQVAVYRGEIVVAGNFGSVNGIAASNIASWDGVRWHPLGQGFGSQVASMVSHHDELFVCGPYDAIGASRWNGSVWADASSFVPPTGVPFSIRPILLREYMGELIAVWRQVSVARRTTDHWETLFSANSTSFPRVNYMVVAGDRIAFGCDYSPGSGPNLALFDGTSFHDCCTLCWANGWGGGYVSTPLDIDGEGTLDFIGSVDATTFCSSCGGYYHESASLMSLNDATGFSHLDFPPYPSDPSPLYCRIGGMGDAFSGGYQYRSGHPYFNFGPRNLSITQPRHDAIFSSMVTNTPPEVNYSWTRNGIAIQDGPTPHGSVISGSHTARLTIHLPSPQDAGSYSLTVENPGCQTASSPAAILSVCLADFNGDSVVDFFDYLDFIAALADDLPAADFNADGVTDFFDYLDFVQAFSTGC